MESEQLAVPLPTVTAVGSVTLFRWTSYDVPFWARKNSRAGRWHHVGDPPTQYWSMSPEAAWAELIRAENLRTEEELDLVRMPLWACRAPSAGLVDLSSADSQSHHGITIDHLVEDSWDACQELGRQIRSDGSPGVIAPCAALDGHHNVTIFGARRKIDWRDRPALARAVPATIVAIGRPPVGLLEQVRRRVTDDEARLF